MEIDKMILQDTLRTPFNASELFVSISISNTKKAKIYSN